MQNHARAIGAEGVDHARRKLMLAGAGAGVVALAAARLPDPVRPADASPAASNAAAYRETEHVRAYYARARY